MRWLLPALLQSTRLLLLPCKIGKASMGITFDLTINLVSIVQTLVILGGGLLAIGAMRATVSAMKIEIESGKTETRESMQGLQHEIKKIGEILINQADQNRRIIHLEEDVRELRHGEGFVRGPRGVDREY